MVDLGYAAKLRPCLVVSRQDPDAPRALVSLVPLTTAVRGGPYEAPLPKVPWLDAATVANVQGLMAVEERELGRLRGTFKTEGLNGVRSALRYLLEL